MKRKHVSYKETKIIDSDSFKAFREKMNIKTVPQLFDGDTHIGGYTDVLDILRNTFNYNKLHEVTKTVTGNLDKIIDINYYPTIKTKRSNLFHRPIGIGVQGLADVYARMDLPYHSEEAKKINKDIFETIYHAALEKSNEIARSRIFDMKTVRNYVDFDVNIFHNIYDDTCRIYNNI